MIILIGLYYFMLLYLIMRFNGRKIKRILLLLIGIVVIIWTGLTIWVEARGPAKSWQFGNNEAGKKALVVFDADPIYNLDEQLCKSFAVVLEKSGWQVSVKTVPAVMKNEALYDLYILCANTYNWAPDRALQKFVKSQPGLDNKPVVAITLGSGSTKRSKRIFEKIILSRTNRLIDSRTFWLLRPNDESRMKEKNVQVAISMVAKWALELVPKLSN